MSAISTKEGLFSEAELSAGLGWLNAANWVYGWPSNKQVPFGHWNVDITNAPITNSVDVSSKLPDAFTPMWEAVNREFFLNKAILTRCYANRHTYGVEGYIHTDSSRASDYTCIVYMDKDWKSLWGGETLFYSEDHSRVIAGVMPSFGSVLSFPGLIPHKAGAVSRMCPKVRTTLMFKVAIDPQAIYPSERLLSDFLTSIGAAQKAHKNGSLKDHLMRVFHIIKSANGPDNLAIMGGLHSVYGTNAFRNACLSPDSDAVASIFGSEVDRVVRLFSTIDRPRVLEEPDGNFSDYDLFVLRCIECANLYDQQELSPVKFPNLYQFGMSLRENRKTLSL